MKYIYLIDSVVKYLMKSDPKIGLQILQERSKLTNVNQNTYLKFILKN